ncbi:Putative auto-transporter adhesin, head GIN domain [Chryseobacterium limigenitum]|uniref:Putative auto-transporter adhesin, head GIN domain n=2 Tax=Chryseobacterium limigenitum TaxID=1612149 RepID=A0A1K2IV63_9FLAO|nr:Putative auto-transporter adhesin, head GIN domain [Chryseobacterium limigenitum]
MYKTVNMKSTTIFIFSAFVLLSSCNDKHERNREDKSNWVDKVTNKDHGPGKEKQYTGDFDEIEVSQAISAEIIKSETERVVVYAPANIIDEILIDKIGSKVHIHYKSGIRVMNGHNVKAKIYVKDFSKLIANSAASITVNDKFTQEKTDIEVSSAASVTGDLEANKFEISADSSSSFDGKIWAVDLDVEASSAASINISGKAKNVDLSSSSGSSLSAKDLIADNLKVDASSGASVEVGATSSIDAEASSGGSVNVYKKGNVTDIKKDESSGGSVTIQ